MPRSFLVRPRSVSSSAGCGSRAAFRNTFHRFTLEEFVVPSEGKNYVNRQRKDMRLIDQVIGRQIIDSRGNPAVEEEVILNDGVIGRASVLSGDLTGEHEAVELVDGDQSLYIELTGIKVDRYD